MFYKIKWLILLLLLLSFSVFANYAELSGQINSLKIELEKLKITQQYNNTNEQKLETSFDKLAKRLEKNIDSKIIASKDIIDRQDERINDLQLHANNFGTLITLFGILITVSIAISVAINFFISNKKAINEIKNWLDKEGKKKLELTLDKMKKELETKNQILLNKIYKESQEQRAKLQKKSFEQGTIFKKEPKEPTELDDLTKNIPTDETKYGFYDWLTLSSDVYYDKKFKKSLSHIKKALAIDGITELQQSNALAVKGFVLERLNEKDEAIKCYDEVIKKFENSKETEILEQVAKALIYKGFVLEELDKKEEAIECYNEVIERFENNNETEILEQVAKAFINKGLELKELDKKEEAIECYDEVIERFEDMNETEMQEQVAKAFIYKGFVLELDKKEEAIECYDEVIERFENNNETEILEQVAKAFIYKGFVLEELDKKEEAIECYDEVIERFEDMNETEMQEQVAKAFINKTELFIIGNKNITKLSKKIQKLFKNNKKVMARIKMLTILSNAKLTKQHNQVKQWQAEYKFTIRWNFNDLDEWANSLEDFNVKKRIKSYIDAFKSSING